MVEIAALYRFTRLEAPEVIAKRLERLCRDARVKGTLLLAGEGINGTIAGPAEGVDRVLAAIRALPGCAALQPKMSRAEAMPFLRLKVRVKPEIVTMGQPGVDPGRTVGTYVAPGDWNALIASDDVAVIDTRNDYEVALGRFAGAIDPGTERFRDFPAWWAANRDRFDGKRVAMYCTGGIRCEKATNYLLGQGVEAVFHLDGGILRYLEEVPAEQSLWQGDCFVFDNRVAVGHGLAPTDWALCHACRRPLMPGYTEHPAYERGVSCPACYGETSEAQRAGYRERQRQVDLARARGAAHIGDDAA